MAGISRISGVAAPLPLANADTDVIMPKRFLRTITREGLADGTFADLRFHEDGGIREDFVLNKKPWGSANILIVGDNFGCGSSREHAVWGLMQLGIDAIIGTTFAGIFFDNARKNGLALASISAEDRDALLSTAQCGARLLLDIEAKLIEGPFGEMPFQMDQATQNALLEGRNDTRDSLSRAAEINGFEAKIPLSEKIKVIL